MRKLMAFGLALGLLLGLAACSAPRDEESTSSESETATKTTPLKTTTQTAATTDSEYNIRRTREVNAEIEEQFQLLIAHKGIVPDEDVRGFANHLFYTCYHLYFAYQVEECHPFLMLTVPGYLPNYQAVASALKGKISPGAARWLALNAESFDFEPVNIIISPELEPWGGNPPEHYIHMAKLWYAFETEYPELADCPGAWQSRISLSWVHGYLNPGSFFQFSEEFEAEYDARQKASMEEFLGDKANTKYPFYEEIQAYYNERFK